MDNHIDAAEAVAHFRGHTGAALRRGDVGGDIVHALERLRRRLTGGGGDPCAGFAQGLDHGRADPPGSARHQRAGALQAEIDAHIPISSRAILSPARVKR